MPVTLPDLSYVQRLRGVDAHSLPGLFLYCLPMGLAVFVWLEVLVLPVLRRTLPSVGGIQWARFLRTDGLPRTVGAWGLVALCLLVGAATPEAAAEVHRVSCDASRSLFKFPAVP